MNTLELVTLDVTTEKLGKLYWSLLNRSVLEGFSKSDCLKIVEEHSQAQRNKERGILWTE